MLIYLRHGDDRGDAVYRHDRSLTDQGRESASKHGKRLVAKYGSPDLVYVSPYRRARQTLEALGGRYDRAVQIRVDPRIAQHLSEKQQREPRVHPSTRALVVIDEDKDTFRRRVAAHVEEVRKKSADARIWCITHQAVIEEVAVHFGAEDAAKDLDFLDHVVMLK